MIYFSLSLVYLKFTYRLDEIDSYMFQTVGHHAIELYAEAMGLPLFRSTIKGTAVCQQANYSKSEEDEVEDLYKLLVKIKVYHNGKIKENNATEFCYY